MRCRMRALLDYFEGLSKPARANLLLTSNRWGVLNELNPTDLILRGCDITVAMTPMTKMLLEQVETWPPEDQEELAEYAREIAARRTGVYHATPEELQAIDEALGQVARGELTSKEEVEAAFAAFRGA
jgi:hypothetical protein